MLNDPVINEELSKQIRKADRFIMVSVIGIFVLIIIMFSVILWQNQSNAEMSRANAIESQKRTQAYIKCIGEQLLVPLAEREPSLFDKCTGDAYNSTKEVK